VATAFSKLKRASWNGIEFPVRHYTVKGSLRYHVHEYPHAWGGAFENLQRKLYEIRMTVPMMATFAQYQDLWPNRWATLRGQFEKGDVGELTIPTVGTIKARCLEWPETFEAKIQSGVMVELAFLEDQSQQFLVDKLVEVDQQRMKDMLIRASGEFDAAALQYQNGVTPYEQSIWDGIISFGNEILAMKDNVELFAAQIDSKIQALDTLIRDADATIRFLNEPFGWPVVSALHDLWQSAEALVNDIQSRGMQVQTWTVPTTMSVTDISTRLYGSNSMSVSLMQMNDFADALAIPQGAQVRYYPDVAA
jgi:prophage DNA circulation protein